MTHPRLLHPQTLPHLRGTFTLLIPHAVHIHRRRFTFPLTSRCPGARAYGPPTYTNLQSPALCVLMPNISPTRYSHISCRAACTVAPITNTPKTLAPYFSRATIIAAPITILAPMRSRGSSLYYRSSTVPMLPQSALPFSKIDNVLLYCSPLGKVWDYPRRRSDRGSRPDMSCVKVSQTHKVSSPLPMQIEDVVLCGSEHTGGY